MKLLVGLWGFKTERTIVEIYKNALHIRFLDWLIDFFQDGRTQDGISPPVCEKQYSLD